MSNYDGDDKTDFGVFERSTATFLVKTSSGTTLDWKMGKAGSGYDAWAANDKPLSGDFSGDGKDDFIVWRPSTGTWYVETSDPNSVKPYWTVQLGPLGYAPPLDGGVFPDVAVADYDGDGKDDLTVWRPSDGTWLVLRSTTDWASKWEPYLGASGVAPQPGDRAVPGDYDGNGTDELAVWRPSTNTYGVLTSKPDGTFSWEWRPGPSGYVPANGDELRPGDYDGDQKTDLAIWSPSTGTWYIQTSGSNYATVTKQWGTAADEPANGDYTGDRKEEIAFWHPSDSTLHWLTAPEWNSNTPTIITWPSVPKPNDYLYYD